VIRDVRDKDTNIIITIANRGRVERVGGVEDESLSIPCRRGRETELLSVDWMDGRDVATIAIIIIFLYFRTIKEVNLRPTYIICTAATVNDIIIIML